MLLMKEILHNQKLPCHLFSIKNYDTRNNESSEIILQAILSISSYQLNKYRRSHIPNKLDIRVSQDEVKKEMTSPQNGRKRLTIFEDIEMIADLTQDQ
jgi:hypothetical protein